MKNLFLFIIFSSSLSFNVFAQDIYQCTDSDGNITTTDTPCPAETKSKTLDIQTHPVKEEREGKRKASWYGRLKSDEMTGEEYCLLYSSDIFISNYKLIDKHTYLYIIVSEEQRISILSREYAKSVGFFDTDTSEMGLKVDDNPFMPVELRADSLALTYSTTSSEILLNQMKVGKTLKGRVSYFPYGNVTSDFEVSLDQFKAAFDDFESCRRKK